MIAVATLLHAPFLARHREPDEALDAETLFEVAFLAAAADGSVGEEERRVLDHVAKGLGLGDVDARVQTLRAGLYESTFEERASAVAGKISTRASRRVAYSLVFVIHVSDLNQAPEEDELEILLEKAWSFGEEAAELKDEVMEFLNSV